MDKLNINPPDRSILEIHNGCLFVDGKPFVVEYPTETMFSVEENKLLTRFRGNLVNYWSHEEIEGYYA